MKKRAKICEKEAVDPRWYRHWGKKQCRESVQNEQKEAQRRGEERKERGQKEERGREGPAATPTSSIIYGFTKLVAKYRKLPNDLEPLRRG